MTPVLPVLLLALAGAVQGADPAPRPAAEILEAAPPEAWITPDPARVVYLETAHGPVILELNAAMANAHREQFRALVREGFYDGLDFYRIVEGFVAQGGDQASEKDRGSAASALTAQFEEALPDGADFTPLGHRDGYAPEAGFIGGAPAGRDPKTGTAWLAHCTGALAFARGVEPDTASTEFYIALQPQRYLDRNMTVIGRVLDGMPVLQSLPRSQRGNGGVIADKNRWTRIVSARLEEDVPAAERRRFQYLDPAHPAFADFVAARAARPSAFFVYRPGYVDLCQLPLPIRTVRETEAP